MTVASNINWLHVLTGSEQTNGLSIRLISISTGAANSSAGFTNKQSSYTLINGI